VNDDDTAAVGVVTHDTVGAAFGGAGEPFKLKLMFEFSV
jgi:hypothetical protein